MTAREQAIADCTRTDTKHRATWTRQQHKDAHTAVENRAALRLELDALGIDHYDRPALARIARIGALLIALGLESDPLEDAIGDSPQVKETREELESYQTEQAELIVERDKLKEKHNALRDAAQDYLDAGDQASREALEELLA